MNAHIDHADRTDQVDLDRTDQVDLAGETLPPVPRLTCSGRAGRRHEPMVMSIARAAPLEMECPRCESRFRIEEIDR